MGAGGVKWLWVRWKAMKLDKEEEEVYMPTDKVFAWHSYPGISFFLYL